MREPQATDTSWGHSLPTETTIRECKQAITLIAIEQTRARMQAAKERFDIETALDCRARIGQLTADWWRLQREARP